MSSIKVHKRALQMLEAEISKMDFSTANVYFVLSYPRSDMGKGTLVAHMLRILNDSDAIKFDGLLNTNQNGRHTAPGHDDFGTYERYNPTKKFGSERYILGGELYKEFISEYGEYENLTFRPYMAKYFITVIYKIWKEMDCPRNLIIEIGGLITDFEVDPFVTAAIREIKMMLNLRCKVVLLGESGYNNEYIKTKSVQDGVSALLQRMIKPDILVIREPSDMKTPNLQTRLEIERALRDKLNGNTGILFNNILSVPFFKPEDIDDYGAFLDRYLEPIIREDVGMVKDRHIFIGSSNVNKQSDWSVYSKGRFQIVTPQDLGIEMEVEEGMVSIEENSMAKANAWSRASGMVTIADDTGFYVDALNGQPGVAVKRWAGALPESVSSKDFFDYMKNMVMPLEDTSCYFKTIVTVASPNGMVKQFDHITKGYIDKALLENGYTSGYPLGLVFKKKDRDKVWADMSESEKRESDRELAEKVLDYIDTLSS